MHLFRWLTALFLALTLLAGVWAQGEPKPSPIAMQVKAALKDPSKPFTMVVQLTVKENVQPKFEAAFARAIKPTRAEKGCLAYELNRDAKTPTQYILYERWQDLPALEAHLKSTHITALLADVGDLLASPPEVRVLTPTE